MTGLVVSDIKVWVGLDVGKGEHHACALDAEGKRLFDKPLPQDESKLRELLTGLQGHGGVLLVVDQPNTIGALPVAVARTAAARSPIYPARRCIRPPSCCPGTRRPTPETRS